MVSGRNKLDKARDKITQKMSRDEAIEVNAATGKQRCISKRAREIALLKTPEQQAAQEAQAAQPIPGNPAPDISPMRRGWSRNRTREPPSAF